MIHRTAMLQGRAALIVGLDDIGVGIAARLRREGARLALLDLDDPERAQRLAARLPGTHNMPHDSLVDRPLMCNDAASNADAVSQSILALGGLDILVCNLLPPPRPCALETLQPGDLDLAFARVRATLAILQTALPALRDSGRGRIVLIGHRYGETVNEALAAYNFAAFGLVGLARSTAVEWGQYQIATNVLLPFARTAEFEAARTRRPAIIERLLKQLPLGRAGDPEADIGGAAAFLASDAACFINGEVLYADGGQHIAGPVLNPARYALA